MKVYSAIYGPVSAATSFTSPVIPVGDNGNIAIGVTLTGADVVGTLLAQGAFTEDFGRPFPLATASNVTASGDTLLEFTNILLPWIRLVWTYTSGTGDIVIDVAIRQPIIGRG